MTATRVVTFGETMLSLSNSDSGLLRHATTLRVRIAGAESNVATGVRRLGTPASWMGRVGDDEFGTLILSTLRGEGIDVEAASIDDAAQTGLMIKSVVGCGITQIDFRRHDSAGSRLAPEHLDEAALEAAGVVHITGITAALSPSARAAVFSAVEVAAAAGTRISFDPNHRTALWHHDEAAAVYRDLAARSDVLLASEAEAALLVGRGGSELEVARALHQLGPGEVVVKRGAHGAASLTEEAGFLEVPAIPVREVDAVGAGDGFCAGYLVGLLDGCDAGGRLQLGADVGAFVVSSPGDWEGLPHRDQLDQLHGPGVRR